MRRVNELLYFSNESYDRFVNYLKNENDNYETYMTLMKVVNYLRILKEEEGDNTLTRIEKALTFLYRNLKVKDFQTYDIINPDALRLVKDFGFTMDNERVNDLYYYYVTLGLVYLNIDISDVLKKYKE